MLISQYKALKNRQPSWEIISNVVLTDFVGLFAWIIMSIMLLLESCYAKYESTPKHSICYELTGKQIADFSEKKRA